MYLSLRHQSFFDFEWLVIDDGSTDNTAELFAKWCDEDNNFSIRNYRQENWGLIRALNRGVALAEGEYFVKIDSDDYVTNDFAKNLETWLAQIEGREDVYGVSGLRVTPDGFPLSGKWPNFPNEEEIVEVTDLERAKYNLEADMCEAWRTKVLREYPFPVWEEEKFAPEQIVFHEIALKGLKIRWYSVAMSVCEFQVGGLTLGASKLEAQNSMGYAMMYNHMLKHVKGLKLRMRTAMQHNALSIVGNHMEYILKSNDLLLSILMLIPGWLLSFRRKNNINAFCEVNDESTLCGRLVPDEKYICQYEPQRLRPGFAGKWL